MGNDLVVVPKVGLPVRQAEKEGVPAIVEAAGAAALFAWDECFSAEIPIANTRNAYLGNVRAFLDWCHERGVELGRVTPGMVGRNFDQPEIRPSVKVSPSTKKQSLSAIRKFFGKLVVRRAILLNPAASVRTQKYEVIEGKTPEIGIELARKLLRSIDVSNVVGIRDRAAIAIKIYTAARVGAVAKLTLKNFDHDGTQWTLRLAEKGGKSREIPVRYDLEQFRLEYLEAAGLKDQPKDAPLFGTTVRRTKIVTSNAMTAVDMCRMVKRRMNAAGLSARLSPHSYRVTTITDLLTQGVPLDDVQHLAGHADARTTKLYDRRDKTVTRNIVERISV